MKLLNDKYFWILLLLTIAVRIYLSFFTYVIQNDSIAYIQNAEHFANGNFLAALRHDYHPLYSLFMAGIYKIVPNMELSGTIVSVLFGTSAVIAFYVMGRGVLDQKIAFASSIIFAFHPYAVRFSASIISESVYLFFFISAFGLGFFAITNRRYFYFALTGACSALAYLARPEGIGVVFVVACWYVLKDFVRIKILWKEKIVSILIMIIAFLIFASPYLLYIKKETGTWQLTKKKNLSQMVGVGKVSNATNDIGIMEKIGGVPLNIKRFDSNSVFAGDNDLKIENTYVRVSDHHVANRIGLKTYLKSLLCVVDKYFTTFHPLLFLFFIIGVINWKRTKKEWLFVFYMSTIIVFYLLILYRLNILTQASVTGRLHGIEYPSRRHVMPIIIPALLCTGVGVSVVIRWINERIKACKAESGFGKLSKHEWLIYLLVLMFVVGVLLPKTLKFQGYDRRGIKEAGQWIGRNSGKPMPVVLSTVPRSAYYAGGRHVQVENIDNVLSDARENNADYILFTQREFKSFEEKLEKWVEDNRIVLVHKYIDDASSNGHNAFVYKVLY